MFQYEELKNAMADLEEDKVLEIMEEVKQTGENVQEAMEPARKEWKWWENVLKSASISLAT